MNNAGILRDRMIVTMTEPDWDAVIGVHLKGTFAVLHHAAAYWRQRAKDGHANDARVINTTSPSGLFGNPGQANYGAAKAGIASLTIIAARELDRYGVTVNAIAPTALTRMTEDIEMMRAAAAGTDLSPEAISPLVVWLGSAESREVTGRVFGVWGNAITVLEGWVNGPSVSADTRWDPAGPVRGHPRPGGQGRPERRHPGQPRARPLSSCSNLSPRRDARNFCTRLCMCIRHVRLHSATVAPMPPFGLHSLAGSGEKRCR